MAKLYVEDARVERKFQTKTGWGLAVVESRTARDGTEYTQRFTLWLKSDPQVEAGWRVSASGFLSVKVDEWQDREGRTQHTAAVSLQSAKVTSVAPAEAAAPEPASVEEAF